MDRVIGRSAGGKQADGRVDDRFFINHLCHCALTRSGEFYQTMHRGAVQRLAQLGARLDEITTLYTDPAIRDRTSSPHDGEHAVTCLDPGIHLFFCIHFYSPAAT